MTRLLVTGSLAYDYILEFPGLLQDSLGCLHEQEKSQIYFQTPHLARFFGGCGGNVSYTLGLLEDNPRLVAITGGDTEDYLVHLRSAGVDVSQVLTLPQERTATCLIVNDQAQNRFVAFHEGVVDRASELSVKAAFTNDVVGCIITPDDVSAMVKFAEECRELELPYYFDFGSMVTWLSADQLRDCVVGARAAFCNEYEFNVFEKKTQWDMARLLEHIPVMVVTRGGEGCHVFLRDEGTVHVPACPLLSETVDPSGAGDAFRAGFGFGRVRGWPWKQAAQLASTTAAFALEARGTQGHRLTKEQLMERCQAVYGILPAELKQNI